MAKEKTLTVVVSAFERLNTSASANPRFRLFTDHGVFDTKSDASCGYTVENGWTIGGVTKDSREAEIVLTSRNTISHLTYLDGDN